MMQILVKGGDVRNGTKANAPHGTGVSGLNTQSAFFCDVLYNCTEDFKRLDEQKDIIYAQL